MAQAKALITGITGQDGSYLSGFLLEKGYKVHGLVCWDAPDQHKARQLIERGHCYWNTGIFTCRRRCF